MAWCLLLATAADGVVPGRLLPARAAGWWKALTRIERRWAPHSASARQAGNCQELLFAAVRCPADAGAGSFSPRSLCTRDLCCTQPVLAGQAIVPWSGDRPRAKRLAAVQTMPKSDLRAGRQPGALAGSADLVGIDNEPNDAHVI